MTPHKGTIVEVRPTIDPEGREAVLIQLEYGYLVIQPDDARDIARRIIEAADEVEDTL